MYIEASKEYYKYNRKYLNFVSMTLIKIKMKNETIPCSKRKDAQ